MIFQLNSTIEGLAATDKPEIEELFSKLVDADRAGRHYFVSRRELCRWAIDNLQLSLRDREHLISIQEQYAVRGGLLGIASAYVDIVIGNDIVSVNEKGVFRVGHNILIQGVYLERSTGFVVEDINADGNLYRHVLNEARKISSIPSYSFEIIHGGGSNTNSVFNHEIEKCRVVVCVVDHDRIAPMDRLGDTADKVLRNCRQRNYDHDQDSLCFIGIGVTTQGRELENYIPYYLLKEMGTYRIIDTMQYWIGLFHKETR